MEIHALQDLMTMVATRRRDLSWTQAELATRAGVSRRWVSLFESGHEKAEVGRVLAVLDALGVRLEADTGDGTGSTPDEDVPDLRIALDDYYAGDS